MELARLILLELEKTDEDDIQNMKIDGYSPEDIKYNAKLLYQKNMIDSYSNDITGAYYIGNLTWDGSNFLDKIRDNSNWAKIKAFIKEKALPLSIDTVINVALKLFLG